MYASKTIRTRVLIISDTHGQPLQHSSLPPVDIAIHCGDLTDESKLDEFRSAVTLLKALPAAVKLVIAGNHDFTLDTPVFKKMVADVEPSLDLALVKETYGSYGEAESLLNDAKSNGITFLHEGTHHFELPTGAILDVYASPFTASKSNWGFTFDPSADHEWDIPRCVDIAITHSPPRGMLDVTSSKQRAGSASLFAAVATARPKLHCFGHIHEGWGAKLVQWRDETEIRGVPSHFTAIDNNNSTLIETLATMRVAKYDTPGMAEEKSRRHQASYEQGYHNCAPIPAASQTLFVNAAVESLAEDQRKQLPWIVEIDLPSVIPPG